MSRRRGQCALAASLPSHHMIRNDDHRINPAHCKRSSASPLSGSSARRQPDVHQGHWEDLVSGHAWRARTCPTTAATTKATSETAIMHKQRVQKHRCQFCGAAALLETTHCSRRFGRRAPYAEMLAKPAGPTSAPGIAISSPLCATSQLPPFALALVSAIRRIVSTSIALSKFPRLM